MYSSSGIMQLIINYLAISALRNVSESSPKMVAAQTSNLPGNSMALTTFEGKSSNHVCEDLTVMDNETGIQTHFSSTICNLVASTQHSGLGGATDYLFPLVFLKTAKNDWLITNILYDERGQDNTRLSVLLTRDKENGGYKIPNYRPLHLDGGDFYKPHTISKIINDCRKATGEELEEVIMTKKEITKLAEAGLRDKEESSKNFASRVKGVIEDGLKNTVLQR